ELFRRPRLAPEHSTGNTPRQARAGVAGFVMSFGQQSGSPASAKQVRELLTLLEAAGHTDFRDARGPMGFTQRQAGGKFSRDEAQAFIDQLEEEAAFGEPPPPPPSMARPKASARPEVSARPAVVARPKASASPVPTAASRAVRDATDDELAAELRRRGWRTVAR
ncbi:MAG: hypothetical protein RJA49_1006, partial [Actinomycetota bacterium]